MHRLTRYSITALLLCLCFLAGNAQEDCLNGIDDDSDGLIDINDPDCTCYVVALDSLLGDFEDMSCCPEHFTGGFGPGIECLEGWSQASIASTDYLHACDYIGGAGIPEWPGQPPSGDGAIGFISMGGWSEYVGTCMDGNMLAGETYSVELYLGFSSAPGWPANSPFEVGIYGTTSCDYYPANGSACLSNLANWYELGTQTVSGNEGEWVYVNFNITSPENIAAIAIGGACSELGGGPQYHFLDDVVIEGQFGSETVDVSDISMTGDCISGVELSVDDVPGASYQWYLDGVAVIGGNTNPFNIQAGENGVYTVVVDNGMGCGSSPGLDIFVETNVLTVQGTVTDIPCNGQGNGEIDLDLPTDNPPVTVSWGTGQTTEDLTDLMPGIYSVTITDDNGCTGVETFFITEPDQPLMVSFADVGQPVGVGAQGSAEVSASGGTPPYMYLWDNGETAEEATMLEPGTHTVTITDANGCEEVLEVTIHPPLILEFTNTPAECFGDCNGSIELTLSGGLPDYSYAWDNGNVSPINMNLCAGIYVVTITDNAGTEIIEDFEITWPDEIIIVGDFTQVVCEGQDAWVETEVSGGTPDYTYIWSNGATTPDIYNLTLEEYTLTVTDANGCTATDTYLIEILDSLVISGEVTQESCGGGGNGAIDISMANGSAPYTYLWSNGFAGEDPDGLTSGMYTVTVTDISGCAGTASFDLVQGGNLQLTVDIMDASCDGLADGIAEVEVDGGVPPYNYTWSNGGSGPSIAAVLPGDYSVTISDNGGCTTIQDLTIGSGPGVDLTLMASNITCAGASDGSIELEVTEGTAPYTYKWSHGPVTQDVNGLASGSYSVTVSDDNGCIAEEMIEIVEPEAINIVALVTPASCSGSADGVIELQLDGGSAPYIAIWNTGANGSALTGLSAGDYAVTVTDASGCSVDSMFAVDEADGIEVEVDVTPASCNGGADGEIDVTVTSGEPPYNYLWNYGQTTEDLTGLTAGTCYLTVTDSRGCTAEIEVTVQGSGSLTADAALTGISCAGSEDGAIDLTVTGGTDPLSYIWSSGQTTEDLAGLGFGTYTVTITDAEGCEILESYAIDPVDPLVITATTMDVSCNGDMDGGVDAYALGGTAPYNYQWSNGATSEDISAVGAGQYSITVTDANGCTFSVSFDISEPDLLEVSVINITQPSMAGEAGTAEIAVSGGTIPYDIQWDNGESGPVATQLDIGTTTVVVTDAGGCSVEIEVEISVGIFSIDRDIRSNICYGECFGEIDLSVNGGLPPYSFNWSNGESSEDLSDLCNGFYSVSVIDGAGNQVEVNMIEVTSPPELYLDYTVKGISCIGEEDASITTSADGGTGPYSYLWQDGSEMSDRSDLGTGTYAVTVSDMNGCTAAAIIDVEEIEELDLDVSTTDIDCDHASGTIVITGNNSPGYSIYVNGINQGSATAIEIGELENGEYTVEYEVSSGCRVVVDQVKIRTISDFDVAITPAETDLTIGDELEMQAVINGVIVNYIIIWTTSDPYECVAEDQYGNCLSILLSPGNGQIVGMEVYDAFGCEDYAEAIIRVKNQRGVFVPNVFSPNGDGANDVFLPSFEDGDVLVRSFRIFNRWGGLVYEETDVPAGDMQGWSGRTDGQDAPPGVYVYTLELSFNDGITEIRKGDVTLIR